tara:strand:+ start:305 stop:1264 length:960 start_codon:yes stop_codon:yes gene_type:complete
MTVEQLKGVNSGVSSSVSIPAVTCTLEVSVFNSTIKDMDTAQNVASDKQAEDGAYKVVKDLFPKSQELDAMRSSFGKARNHGIYKYTIATGGKGSPRLLPIKNLEKCTRFVDQCEQEYKDNLNKFLNSYDSKVSEQAFKLGKGFDATQYPSKHEVAKYFSWQYSVMPLPQGGIGGAMGELFSDISDDFKQRFEYLESESKSAVQKSIDKGIQKEITEGKGLKEFLENVVTRLKLRNETEDKQDSGEDIQRAKISNSLITNPLDKAQKLQDFNFSNDPKITELCIQVVDALGGVDKSQLDDSRYTRDTVIAKVGGILDKF